MVGSVDDEAAKDGAEGYFTHSLHLQVMKYWIRDGNLWQATAW